CAGQPVWLYCLVFSGTATTEIYPLSLHDALPIYTALYSDKDVGNQSTKAILDFGMLDVEKSDIDAIHEDLRFVGITSDMLVVDRSEEHTSELQSRENLVCRLLLEKKKHEHTTAYD